MQIDPKFAFWFGVWTNVLVLIAAGGMLDHMVPALWIPVIGAYAVFFVKVNGVILTAFAGLSSAKAGPLVNVSPGKGAGAAIVAFASLAAAHLARLLVVVAAVLVALPIGAASAATLPGAMISPPTVPPVAFVPPKPAACVAASCPDWFVGGTLIGEAGNANVIGGGLTNSVFASGGMIGIDGGYRYWDGTWYMGLEGMALIESQANNGVVGTAPGGFVGILQVKLGGNAAAFFSPGTDTTSQAPITIPQKLQSSLMAPYIAFGEIMRKNGNAFGTGAGAEFTIGGAWTWDTEYLYSPGANGEKPDNLVLMGANYNFSF